MALAFLRFAGTDGEGRLQYDVELGRNRFYGYAIGDDEVDRTRGFAVLANPSYTSPLFGPIADHPVGRTSLVIPPGQFDREHQYLQLTSFRTRRLVGPAISEIVRVPVGLLRGGGDLPSIDFGMGTTMLTSTAQSVRQRPIVAFAYSEAPRFSEAQFFASLLPILQNIIPKVLPVVQQLLPAVGQLFGGGGSRPAAGGPAASPAQGVLNALTQPDTVKLLQQLLEQIAAAKGGGAQQASLSMGAGARRNVFAPGGGRRVALDERYSEAKFAQLAALAPMLLQALPALMPVLEKVLSPEMVKSVLENVGPAKMIGAVTDGIKEIGKIGLDIDKQSNEHLRALNPMGVHGAVDSLLAGMSLARSAGAPSERDPAPLYRRIEEVTVNFADISPVMIHGRTRVCYRHGADLGFPLTVETPREIVDARVVVMVKDAVTRRLIAEARLKVPSVTSGRLAVAAVIPAAQLSALVPNEDYLVCTYLLWRNKAKKVLGTSRSQLVTIVGEYTFDRVDESTTLLPLNDVDKFREFWHKPWQQSFTKDLRRAELECKYYYALEPDRSANAAMATVLKEGDSRDRVTVARLKSGMIVSLTALNRLVPLIAAAPALSESELAALRSPDFVARFNQAARFKASFHARPGGTAALWIYPAMKLQQVVLLKASRSNGNGHVEALAEHPVRFPMPALIHTIGARTTG